MCADIGVHYFLLLAAGSVSWLSLATVVNSPSTAVAAMLLSSFSTACSDVVVDSLVVERARGEPAVSVATVKHLAAVEISHRLQ